MDSVPQLLYTTQLCTIAVVNNITQTDSKWHESWAGEKTWIQIMCECSDFLSSYWTDRQRRMPNRQLCIMPGLLELSLCFSAISSKMDPQMQISFIFYLDFYFILPPSRLLQKGSWLGLSNKRTSNHAFSTGGLKYHKTRLSFKSSNCFIQNKMLCVLPIR